LSWGKAAAGTAAAVLGCEPFQMLPHRHDKISEALSPLSPLFFAHPRVHHERRRVTRRERIFSSSDYSPSFDFFS